MCEIIPIPPGASLPRWFTRKRWRDAQSGKLLDRLGNFLIAVDDGVIVAAAQFVQSAMTGKIHFGSLYVDERHRGYRLGQKLFRALLKYTGAKEVYLDTSKPGLIPYYEELGFVRMHHELALFKQELHVRHPEKDLQEQIFMQYSAS